MAEGVFLSQGLDSYPRARASWMWLSLVTFSSFRVVTKNKMRSSVLQPCCSHEQIDTTEARIFLSWKVCSFFLSSNRTRHFYGLSVVLQAEAGAPSHTGW